MTNSLTVVDSLGQELLPGDRVAYVARYGSSIEIQGRVVQSIGIRNGEPYLQFVSSTRYVNPANTVKLEKSNATKD